jgi:3-deoxy-D-manno-octulosonic-acid transferase
MLQVYKYLTYLLFPVVAVLIYFRSIFNKEDKIRFKEKIFSSHFKINKNNNKKLIWFHAASIGECLSILPLIDELNSNYKDVDFLITTITLSSASLLERKINQTQNIVHRFFPLDCEHLVENFLNNWKPTLICFVDSEIWPNFLFKIKEKNIPLLLLNARLTRKSFNKWKIISSFANKIFENFDLCLAASEESKNNLKYFQVKKLKYIGNLKYSAQSLPQELNETNKKILNNYKVWCATSIHSGEETSVLKTHMEIKKKINNVLTIIVPRHINRSLFIKNLSQKLSLNVQILNEDELVNSNVEILIINSFGSLSKYFNYCKNIFIGKSLLKEKKNVGGQNPIEAAKLGCKIFHGPYVYNFQEVYELLCSYGITEKINNEIQLSEELIKNFKSQITIDQKKIDLINNYGEKILKETMIEIGAYLK